MPVNSIPIFHENPGNVTTQIYRTLRPQGFFFYLIFRYFSPNNVAPFKEYSFHKERPIYKTYQFCSPEIQTFVFRAFLSRPYWITITEILTWNSSPRYDFVFPVIKDDMEYYYNPWAHLHLRLVYLNKLRSLSLWSFFFLPGTYFKCKPVNN